MYWKLKQRQPRGEFTGYASGYALDNHGDVVEKGAFRNSLTHMAQGGMMPKMLWQHDPTQPIGRWEIIREDIQGLYVKGRLFLDLLKGREAHILMREGVVWMVCP